jgi:hypothetical protein
MYVFDVITKAISLRMKIAHDKAKHFFLCALVCYVLPFFIPYEYVGGSMFLIGVGRETKSNNLSDAMGDMIANCAGIFVGITLNTLTKVALRWVI